MPVFTSKTGRVVAWSGVQSGPIEERDPIGRPSGWVRYEAEVGVGGGENAKAIVRIQKSWRDAAPIATLTQEGVERSAVEEKIKPHALGEKWPLQSGAENNFTISKDEMMEFLRNLEVQRK